MPAFTQYMRSEWSGINMRDGQRPFDGKTSIFFPSPIDLPQILIWYLYQLYPNTSKIYQIDAKHPQYQVFQQNVKDLQKYTAMINIIK